MKPLTFKNLIWPALLLFLLHIAFTQGKEGRLRGFVWFLNQANREPFKTQPFLLSRQALVPNELQPQVGDGHSRKKFNTHPSAPIKLKAKGEEVCFQLG